MSGEWSRMGQYGIRRGKPQSKTVENLGHCVAIVFGEAAKHRG